MAVLRNPQQLLLVKQIYQDALQWVVREDSLSLMKAVLFLDLAVEQMLNVLILDFDLTDVPEEKSSRGDRNWKSSWGRATKALTKHGKKGLSQYPALSRLHELRNLAQHNGTCPSASEVRRYTQPVADMLTNAFQDAYSLNFEQFRLWDLVENEELRQLFLDCEEALQEGDSDTCIVGCSVAYRLIVEALRKYTALPKMRRFSGDAKHYSWTSKEVGHLAEVVEKDIQRARDGLFDEIDSLENELVATGVGLPIMDTRRFLQTANLFDVGISDGGHWLISRSLGTSSQKEDEAKGAEFMLDYLSRLVRLVDEGYPKALQAVTVKIPFREQQWWKARCSRREGVQ